MKATTKIRKGTEILKFIKEQEVNAWNEYYEFKLQNPFDYDIIDRLRHKWHALYDLLEDMGYQDAEI